MSARTISGLLFGLALSLTALAQNTPAVNPQHPQRYEVVAGDTLWDISARFLRDPWRWKDLWQANPQIKNPNLIYPGDVISLREVDGRLTPTIERGLPVVKLSPQVRTEPLHLAVPTIPVDVIRPFLSRPRVVSEAQFADAPYVVAQSDRRLASATGDRIYVRGLRDEGSGRFSVFRRGETYRNPADRGGDILGYEAVFVADAKLEREGDPATLLVTQAAREVLPGDRILPAEDREVDQHFYPRAPAFPVEGRIISVADGVARAGKLNIVALNLGEQDGLEVGDVLAVYQAGDYVEDPVTRERVKLPPARAGLVIVFRTFDRVSYALVMEALKDLRLYDAVQSPDAPPS